LPGDLGNQSDKALRAAEGQMADWRFNPDGSEGYAKAEVTAGGIATTAAKDDGGQHRPRSLRHWRGGGCNGLAGRL
jgi:hypothetical protein